MIYIFAWGVCVCVWLRLGWGVFLDWQRLEEFSVNNFWRCKIPSVMVDELFCVVVKKWKKKIQFYNPSQDESILESHLTVK